MTDRDLHGPVDFLLVEFPSESQIGSVADALIDLYSRNVVALYDIVLVAKDATGSTTRLDIGDPAHGFAAFAGAQSGLFGDDDVEEAAAAMEPGTTGLLIVYENLWALGFVGAALEAGGQAIASERIPAQVLIEALDADETTATGG